MVYYSWQPRPLRQRSCANPLHKKVKQMDHAVIQLHSRRENPRRKQDTNKHTDDRHSVDVRKHERQYIIVAVFLQQEDGLAKRGRLFHRIRVASIGGGSDQSAIYHSGRSLSGLVGVSTWTDSMPSRQVATASTQIRSLGLSSWT